jgi:superfamily I DNA/RNA helicase
MEFRIADTFTDSLTRLTGEEQKVVKTTAFDLQPNPAQPGMQFHRLDKARDPNFWSVRVNRDVRLIVHKTDTSLLLCYVDHHDDAYRWAERRRLETHPKTGAAQLVEIRETVKEIFVPAYKEVVEHVSTKAFKVLDKNLETTEGHVSICTMHLAKGLEFRVVAVMACDDELIPLQQRIETAADDSDLEEVYNTERNLLYVACTRARDHLLITSVEPASEFLDDLRI